VSSDGTPEQECPEINLTVNTVAASFDVKVQLETFHLAKTLNFTEWKNSSTVVLQINKPSGGKMTAHVHKSGKVNLMGAVSEEEARIGGRRIARLIQVKANYPEVVFANFRITSVSVSARLAFGVILDKFAQEYRHAGVEYEPELCFNAIYKTTDPKATIHISHTGSVTVIGAKSVNAAGEAVNQLYPMVHKFKKSTKAVQLTGRPGRPPKAVKPDRKEVAARKRKSWLSSTIVDEDIDWSDMD